MERKEKLLNDLKKYNIENVKEIYYNLSYEELFEHETNPELTGYERGYVTASGAVAVDTGIFTGRSPKDKYIVYDEETKDKVWWAQDKNGSDNKPISKEIWNELYQIASNQLSGKKLYITDAYCGANEASRLKIRVITEVAWMSHFVKNMFIRPTEDELENFEPDFVMLNACKAVNNKWEEHKLNSDVFIAFNLTEKLAVIGGTWYGGEIKKGFFSVMNYYLPLKGIASMHCSANMGRDGDTAIFFGLSGTGKTTLSTDPKRYLIGDDEHGWDDDGIFNLEGGCYAKCINLNKEKEPDIYNAIRRNALLENVVFDPETGIVNYADASKTENTRVSYPIYHIKNIVQPISKGGHPKYIIFLSADAFGVLPPVAKLTKEQAMYYFLSGYTAKLAGTERGIKEPIPTFSACFGAAFLLLHPIEYAKQLAEKMEKYNTTAYLVNTGWIGGPYGIGQRIDITTTRNIISAILEGQLDNAEYEELPIFGLYIPKEIKGIDSNILNPAKTWKYESQYNKQAQMLADKFIENFEKFTDHEIGKKLVVAGPKNRYIKEYYNFYLNKIKELEKEYNDKISLLKVQLYEIQNTFSDYVSFNFISNEYKNTPLTRYVPIYMFIDTRNSDYIYEIETSMLSLMRAIDFEIEKDFPAERGLWIKKYIMASKYPLTNNEVQDKLNNIELFLKASDPDDTSFDNHFKAVCQSLISSLENVQNATIKIGNILIVRATDDNKISHYFVKNLKVNWVIHIEKNQHLFRKPLELIRELSYFENVHKIKLR